MSLPLDHAGDDHAAGWKKLIVRQLLWRDSAVRWINLTSLWSISRGMTTAVFIITYLSPAQQGVWYAFINLAALSVFAELGFSNVVSQFVSHEFSRLKLGPGGLTGAVVDIDRLVGLVRYAIRIYCLVVPAAVVVLAGAGGWFFWSEASGVTAAWLAFSASSGFTLLVNMLLSVYRGLDEVAAAQRASLAATVAGTLVTWLALFGGLAVWALVLGNFVTGTVLIVLLRRNAPAFWHQIHRHQLTQRTSWAREIVTLQGKYAVIFISCYFIFNLTVPAVFKRDGAVMAGQLGLTMTAVATMQSFALAGVNSRMPRMSMLLARNEREECFALVKSITMVSLVLYLAGAAALVGMIWALDHTGIWAGRFLDLPNLLLLLGYQFAATLTSGASAFLRAHKEEPHLAQALTQGALIAVAVFSVLPKYGLFWLLVVFNFSFWCVSAPWIWGMVLSFRRREWPQFSRPIA